MRKEDKLLCLGIFIGFGVTVAAMALPLWYPNAPQWVWGVMFIGGLSIAAYSSLVLCYELFIKLHLTREVKLIPLTMIICGILLIAGGIIYHLYDKKPQLTKISPIKQPSADEIAAQIIKKLPEKTQAGNLKQRAYDLSDEILWDLYRHGWPQSHKLRTEKKWPPYIGPMPETEKEGLSKWMKSRSGYFKFRFLQDVININNEFAEMHIKDPHLDSFLYPKSLIIIGMDPKHGRLILSQEIEEIALSLRNMADQIK